MTVAAGAAQRSGAEQNDPSAPLVAWLTASWPGGYSNGSAAVSTDRLCGDLVVRNCHVVSNRHVVLNSPLRRRPHPSASFCGPALSLEARTVVVGARSVTRFLAGDNCAVRAHCCELRRLNCCLPITASSRHHVYAPV